MFLDLLLLWNEDIKINGIDIHCGNVISFSLVSFLLYTVDCAAFCTPGHLSEMVHLVALYTVPPIYWASSRLMACTTVFAFCACGHFNGCVWFYPILLQIIPYCLYYVKLFHLT